jgi:hypothetical protein
MRVSVVIGKLKSGAWEVLALPDKQIEDQKTLVKSVINTNGLLGEGRKGKSFVEVLRFEKYVKRARFSEKVAPVVEAAPAE